MHKQTTCVAPANLAHLRSWCASSHRRYDVQLLRNIDLVQSLGDTPLPLANLETLFSAPVEYKNRATEARHD